MFSSCFSLLSHLNSTLKMHSWQQFSSDLSPTSPGKDKGCPVLCRGWCPSSPVSPPFPPQPNGHLAAFILAVLCFFTSQCNHPMAIVLLYYFLHCPEWVLLGSLSMDSAVYCFSTPRCLLFLLPLCSLCSCYMLCSAVPCSHGIALFHVPNDCSSLFEKCLL